VKTLILQVIYINRVTRHSDRVAVGFELILAASLVHNNNSSLFVCYVLEHTLFVFFIDGICNCY